MKQAYFAPIIKRDCGPLKDTRIPKYLLDKVGDKRTIWSMIDYGSNDYCLCVVEDAPPEILGPVAAAADAVLFPVDLEIPIGSSVYTQIQGLLEPIGIPVDKFSGATKGHVVPAFLMQHFMFACRKQGIYGSASMGSPIPLSTKVKDLAPNDYATTVGTLEALKLDAGVFPKNVTLREALNTLAVVMPMDDLQLLGLPFTGQADAKLRARGVK